MRGGRWISGAVVVFTIMAVLVLMRENDDSRRSDIKHKYLQSLLGSSDSDSVSGDDEEEDLDEQYQGQGEAVKMIIREEEEDDNKDKMNAEEKADYLLDELRRSMQEYHTNGPIIVGGIGDSGTRGARATLMRLGVNMLSEDYINPVSKDSAIFMAAYEVSYSNGMKKRFGPSHFYAHGIKSTNTLKYNQTTMSKDDWNTARQYISKMVHASMKVSQREKSQQSKPLDPWGFKHPRTALLLPIFKGTLGKSFKFIHILRDGKDVAYGDNNRLFRETCTTFFAPRYGLKSCPNTSLMKLQLWVDLNTDLFEWAAENLGKDQYFPIRIEDLVLGKFECYEQLARFVGAPFDGAELARKINDTITANGDHSSSYFGNHYTSDTKAKLADMIKTSVERKRSKGIEENLHLLGYGGGNDYALRGTCTDLLHRFAERQRY